MIPRAIRSPRASAAWGRLRGLAATLAGFALLLASTPAFAVGGKPAEKLVNVADTRALSGLAKWIADVYNSSMWLYGLVVVVVMVAMGLILGFGMDRAMGMLGIELGKIDHHE